MNAERSDFDRALRTWFEDGPTVLSDRVVDVIADRIARQPQRRAWRLRGRSFMNTYLKLAAALAAVLVVAVVGYNLLPGRTGPGAPTSAPTSAPTPSIQPSAAASEVAACTGVVDVPDADGLLDPCRYRFRPSDTYAVEADIPDGWSKFGTLLEVVGPGANGPSGVGVVFQAIESGLYSDACHWDLAGTGELKPGDVEVGPEVQDLVDALRANTSYTATKPSPITFGPYQGKRLEIQIPTDLDLDTCDVDFTGAATYRVAPGTLYAQGQGNRWDMSIVDVEGTRVIVTIIYYEGTPAADLEAARAIVDSLEFTP